MRTKSEQSASPNLARLKRYLTEAQSLTFETRRNSLACIDYYDSDQFTREELAILAQRNQPPIVINRIKPAVNGIIGVTERGRSDPRAWPRQPADAACADVATDALRYIADFNRFKRTKQDVFRDILVPGTGAALVGADADLNVTITQVRWEEFFADPRSRRADFKDARYLGIAKWMYLGDAQALWPDQASALESSVNAAGVGLGGMDESYQDRPFAGPGAGGAWVDPKERRLMVVELYHQDAGWRRSVFTGVDLLEDGPSPYLDHKGRPDCPIEAQSLYVRRDNGRYGAVWDMIGPQDEINKRRSKSVHLLSTTRIEVRDPQAIDVDADVARREASRPDGVIPYGWGLAPNTVEFRGNLEMLQEAKAEIERMAPNPAILGRDATDSSGRAVLARQQSGLTELAVIYGVLEDFELRVYRQCWSRAKQYWTAPQWIRVSDDEGAPRFVGLNQPVTHPGTGEVLGYANRVAEMDVDIEVNVQPEIGTVQQEAFQQLMQLVGSSPIYQQQIPLSTLIQLSPVPHKRGVLDVIERGAAAQARANETVSALAQAKARAEIAEATAKSQEHAAGGFAKALDSLTYAHRTHADVTARAVEAGLDRGPPLGVS